MKICSICHKISASDEDHLDCKEKRRVELEDEDLKQNIPEKLDIARDPSNIHGEIKVVLDHMTREKKPEEV